MAAAELGLLSGILAALIAALTAIMIAYYQRRNVLQDEHRLRAFERHLEEYRRIFVACRSLQDALDDYVLINKHAAARSDPFLHQVLDILQTCAHQYCSAVNWQYNPGMAYIDIVLEEKCQRLRKLLLEWLSKPHLSDGDIVMVRREGVFMSISPQEVQQLDVCDYQELRTERVTVVDHDDAKLVSDISKAADGVSRNVRAVMSH